MSFNAESWSVASASEMANVFISYAHADRSRFVQPLASTLQDRHNVWYDTSSVQPSDSVPLKISEGMGRSEHALVVISRSYLASSWCMRELGALLMAFASGDKDLLVIRLDHAPVPDIISDVAYIEP